MDNNLDNLTLGQIRAALTSQQPATTSTKVIVRSRDAGCVYGDLVRYDAATREVVVANAQQMWQWKAKKDGTLIGCAVHGVEASKCKFPAPVAEMTVLEACAIIKVHDSAVASFSEVTWS